MSAVNDIEVVDQNDEPWVGTKLLINAADGTVVSVLETDSMGRAAVDIPDGGTVSALFSGETYLSVQAVRDPPNGEPIRFMYPRQQPPSPTEPTEYSVYADQYPAGTAVLHFASTCDTASVGGITAGGEKADLTNEYCLDAAQHDFLVVAYDTNLVPLEWGMQTGVGTNPGGLVEVAVYLTQTAVAQADVSLTNIPGAATRADIDFAPLPGPLNERAYISQSPPAMPTMAGTLKVANVPGTKWRAMYSVQIEATDGYSGLGRWKQLDAWPASDTFSADALVYVSMNALDVSDPIHPTATWLTSEGDRGDQVRVYMSWGGATGGVDYLVRLPPEHETSYRVPDFPPELSSYSPAATSVFGGVSAAYEDYDITSGYAATLAAVPAYQEDHVISAGQHE